MKDAKMKSFFIFLVIYQRSRLQQNSWRVLEEFRKNSKAIWFLRSEQTALVTVYLSKRDVIVSEDGNILQMRSEFFKNSDRNSIQKKQLNSFSFAYLLFYILRQILRCYSILHNLNNFFIYYFCFPGENSCWGDEWKWDCFHAWARYHIHILRKHILGLFWPPHPT